MNKKTINIYTSKEDRKTIDKLKVKYQLSLTTIIDILLFVTTKYLNEESIKDLANKYKYKKSQKTSIKTPKIYKDLKWENIKENIYATNVLQIYLKKDINKYIENKETLQKYYNDINNKMTTTNDEFWNYNQHIRMQRRMLRENKEYFKKELENA